MSGFQKKL